MNLLTVITNVGSFVIIQLPAGDHITTLAVRHVATGQVVEQATLDGLRIRFRLDQPARVQ